MIELGIYFDINHNREVVDRLIDIEGAFAPLYYSADETKKPKLQVSNQKEFEHFRKNNILGYMLYGDKVEFSLTLSSIQYSNITVWIKDENLSEEIPSFIKYMADNVGIVFIYASTTEEYKHRNRFEIQLGNNYVESWFGRDLRKNISGFYWMTYISSKLINQFDLNVNTIKTTSLKHYNLGNGILFNFFESANKWEDYKDDIDSLCSTLDGVFSIIEIKKVVSVDMNYFDFMEATEKWS